MAQQAWTLGGTVEGGIWQGGKQGHQDKRQWKARGNQEGPQASVVGVQSQISQFQITADTPEQNPTSLWTVLLPASQSQPMGTACSKSTVSDLLGATWGGTPQAVRALAVDTQTRLWNWSSRATPQPSLLCDTWQILLTLGLELPVCKAGI